MAEILHQVDRYPIYIHGIQGFYISNCCRTSVIFTVSSMPRHGLNTARRRLRKLSFQEFLEATGLQGWVGFRDHMTQKWEKLRESADGFIKTFPLWVGNWKHSWVFAIAKTQNPDKSRKVYAYPLTYCWWLKSCTAWDVWNPTNNGINYLSTGAGFQPSTVSMLLLPRLFWDCVVATVPPWLTLWTSENMRDAKHHFLVRWKIGSLLVKTGCAKKEH